MAGEPVYDVATGKPMYRPSDGLPTEDCGADPCEFCDEGTMPVSKTVTISGVVALDPVECEDCDEVNDAFLITTDGFNPCRLSASFELTCGLFYIQLTFISGSNSIDISLGPGSNENFVQTGQDDPRDCAAESDGAYTYAGGLSPCDWSGATVTVS